MSPRVSPVGSINTIPLDLALTAPKLSHHNGFLSRLSRTKERSSCSHDSDAVAVPQWLGRWVSIDEPDTPGAARDWILSRLHSEAEWRSTRAAEQPEDPRQAHAAQQLLALADYVKRLPNDDLNIRALSVLLETDNESIGPTADYMITHVDLPEPATPDDFDKFLADLVSVTANEAVNFGRELLDANDEPEEEEK